MSTPSALSVSRVASAPFAGRSGVIGYLLLFASGFAGLGYELAWARMLAAGLGHEITAVLAVLAAFFVGLGLGGAILGPLVRRAVQPLAWYVALEAVIGVWALALIPLVPAFNDAFPRALGSDASPFFQGALAFVAVLFLLLPATVSMGATLPAMERLFARAIGTDRVAGLYAVNTIGAFAGVVVVSFFLAPQLGFRSTLLICASLNFGCALAAWAGLRHSAANRRDLVVLTPDVGPAGTLTARRLLMTLFVGGFLSIGYEVSAVRLLRQVLEDTVYTFAGVLGIYLLGTAAGAAWQQKQQLAADPLRMSRLLAATSITLLLGSAVLWFANDWFAKLSHVLGPGQGRGMAIEFLLASLALAPPAFAMGALFAYLSRHAIAKTGLGLALGVNTLGGAAAPLLCGVLLFPLVGGKWILFGLAAGYLLLLPVPTRLAGVAGVGLLLLALSPPVRHVDMPDGSRLLDFTDGVLSSVAVVEDAAGARHLKVDNHFTMGSTSSGFADHRQTHMPLLLHPQPQRALFLGVGTGMSLSAARLHPNLDVTAVELLPEALERLHWFGTDPEQLGWAPPPKLVATDARRFLLSTQQRFDVVIADLFHPSRDGAGALYTVEHFEAIRDRLEDNGLFVQWLPLFQMDLATLQSIVASFTAVYPEVGVFLPHFSLQQPVVGLIGGNRLPRFDTDYLAGRVLDPGLQRALVESRLNSDGELFGGYLGDRTALLRFAETADLNTDDRPVVTYEAPRFAYSRQGDHGRRLNVLVSELRTARDSRYLFPHDSVLRKRMENYWLARDRYLEIGLEVRADMSPADMRARTTEPLLQVLRLSEEFQAAYVPLLNQAWSLRESDPASAAGLLRQLISAAPNRLEAQRALRLLEEQNRE